MKENNPHILGTEKVGKLLLEYSIPAIIGMTLTSLYNIIDSVFIGHGVGAMAISGLAISFPLMNLLVAFCTLVGAWVALPFLLSAWGRRIRTVPRRCWET